MDYSEPLSAIRLIAAFVVLAYASSLDLRTRRVPNKYWIALSLFGLVMVVMQVILDDEPLEYLLVLIPVVAILSDIYLSGAEGTVHGRFGPFAKYSVAIVFVILIGVLWGSDQYAQKLLSVPVMMLIVVALYVLDAIRGGADAKAFVALAVVFPFYPSVGPFPLISAGGDADPAILPFSLVVLFTTAVIVALTPIYFLVRNAARGDLRFPQAFFGYRTDTSEAQKTHVWLMERMEGGKHVLFTRPKLEEDLAKELRMLEAGGHTRVWVTPKIPLIVPLLIALVFATVVGNLLALLFPL